MTDGTVDVSIEIDDERTLVTVDGERAAALVVESASGERIYLPPEAATTASEDSSQTPYDASESPYDAAGPDATPYESGGGTPYESADTPYDAGPGGQDVVGVQPTAEGFRVLHPEPVTDVRLLRQ